MVILLALAVLEFPPLLFELLWDTEVALDPRLRVCSESLELDIAISASSGSVLFTSSSDYNTIVISEQPLDMVVAF